MLGGDKDRKFRKPRWNAGLVTAEGAECLRQFAECRSMQIAKEGAAHLELAAWT
jgi:hypothetical protein